LLKIKFLCVIILDKFYFQRHLLANLNWWSNTLSFYDFNI
jgi:hypothetical protein